MTETLTWHPELCTTVVSSGRWSVPHVVTSVALEFAMMRVNTKLNASAEGQLEIDGKLTLSVVPDGRIGRAAEATSVSTNCVVSCA